MYQKIVMFRNSRPEILYKNFGKNHKITPVRVSLFW